MEPTLDGAAALARNAHGPLAPHLPALISSLIEQNYSVVCLRAKAWRAVGFDDWLARHGVELTDVDDELIDLFHRRKYLPHP